MSFLSPLLRRSIPTPRTVSLIPHTRAFSSTQPTRLAKVTIIGYLTADAERSATSTGSEIIRYSVASKASTKPDAKTSFFNISAFEENGNRREYLAGLQKGSLVYVEGVLKQARYEDRDGNTRNTINIHHRSINVLRRGSDQQGADELKDLSGDELSSV